MNKKQLKDLHSALNSIELNEMVLSNIQQMIENEKIILEGKRDNYESKGTDYWDNKATGLEDRINTLEEEADGMEELVSSLQEFIELMREKIGYLDGNTVLIPSRAQAVTITEQKRKFLSNKDPLFNEIAQDIVSSRIASTSGIQRRYSIGFARAGKIMDQLEAAGIVGPSNGGKMRQVLVDIFELETILHN